MSSAISSTSRSSTPLPGRPKTKSTPFSSHHFHDLRAAVMAVAANGDPGLWPVPADATDETTQVTAHLDARGRLAGAQQHGDRPARRRVVDMDRQETALVVMGVEQRELLMAVDDIHRIVDIERHGR